MAKGKGSGWHKNPRGHSLAARGIPCRANAIFRPYRPTGWIDYSNPVESFKAFWKASIEGDWSEFNFDKAFGFMKEDLEDSLENLGMLSDDNMRHYIKMVSGQGVLSFMKRNADIIYDRYITREDLSTEEKEALMVHDLRMEEEDSLYYADWIRAYRKLERGVSGLSIQEKIFLMDELIDLEHDRGSAFYDPNTGECLDVMKIREEFDKEYGRFSP